MDQQCVVGVFNDPSSARQALAALEKAGFSHEHVSLVTSNVKEQVEDEEMLEFGDQAAERAVTGAGIGGLVGFLLSSPLLMAPGIGPVLVAGPIAVGGIVGGFLGAMTGWGVEPNNVQKYQQLVQQGAELIVVQGDPVAVVRAHAILEEESAAEVYLHAQSSTDSPEIDDRPT